MNLMKMLAATAACALALLGGAAHAEGAASLRAKHTELRDALRNNNFQRAMHVDSSDANNTLQGDVYAVLDHPFAKVSQALNQPSEWCDVMLLPFNTKACHAVDNGQAMVVRIGRKFDQPVEQATRLQLAYRNVAQTNDYFETRLSAAQGPFGTRDYRITLSAVPIEGNKTFMHLSYAYGYGSLGKMAMQAYLSTAGADKVGFSNVKDANGQNTLMTGMRGAIERNAMRYYLAIDAYLDSLDAPKDQQIEKRIQQWFTATERYPRQLREMDRNTYVNMKRNEYERQQTAMVQ